MPLSRTLAGFAAEKSAAGFVVHIIDDAGEVFEIEASRESLELIVENLQNLIAGRSAEDARAKG